MKILTWVANVALNIFAVCCMTYGALCLLHWLLGPYAILLGI